MSLMISADSHVIEPPDLYSALSHALGDRAPHVRSAPDGTDWWWIDGQRSNSFAGGSQAGRRFSADEELVLADAVDNVRSAVWTPDRYVEDNLSDGIGVSVLYPTQQMQHYGVPDRSLLSATCRVYNDWLAEFCRARPERLRGVAMLNVDDPVEAASELERAAGRGLRSAMIPVALPRRDTYADPRFGPLWAAAEGLGVPLSFHIGTYRVDPDKARAVTIAGAAGSGHRPVLSSFATADLHVRTVLADLIFSGVLERHPALQVVSAEHEIGWFAHFVERLDYTYTQRATKGHRFADGLLPGDLVRRQVTVQFCEDPLADAAIARVGARNVIWGGDYPHSEGTFPRSVETVARLLAGCDDHQRRAVLADNAAELYGVDDAVLTS